jgi:hypothetical protein
MGKRWLIGVIFLLFLMGCAPQPQEESIFNEPTSTVDIVPKKYGLTCTLDKSCGDIVGIDCNAAVDGPYYYVNKVSGDIISKCGGFCLTSDPEQLEICRTMCPPPAWDC